MVKFRIEDDFHAELIGEFDRFEDAVDELRRIASIPWGVTPNRPPCRNSANCQRDYIVIQYDITATPWRVIERLPALEMTAQGTSWLLPFEDL